MEFRLNREIKAPAPISLRFGRSCASSQPSSSRSRSRLTIITGSRLGTRPEERAASNSAWRREKGR